MKPGVKALMDYYTGEKSSDFHTAYLYLKHMDQIVKQLSLRMGTPINPKITAQEIAPEIDDMIQVHSLEVANVYKDPDTNTYHGKVVQLDDAKKLFKDINLEIEVPDTVVPFKLARDIIMREGDRIAVGKCACRAVQENCTCMEEPYEACFFIGDPHVSFLLENNPDFREVTTDEAVSMLEDFHKRGFVHNALFKKEMGGRLFALCNCCECCCQFTKLHNIMNKKRPTLYGLAASGYVAEIGDDCTGCGKCAERCPFHAISLDEDGNKAQLDPVKCMGCGVCESVCDAGNLHFNVDPSKGGILDLDVLKELSK